MANKVTFTMNNVPAGLDSMYVRVEEDALTAGVRNVLHSGVQAVTGNTIDIDIGENGTVGNGAIISADNYTSGGAAFKSMTGYALIEAGDIPVPSNYSNVVVIGSSIIQASFGRDLTTPNADATSQIQAQGATGVSVYGYGWSGYTMSLLTPKIQDAFDAFPNNDTLFILECGINDIVPNIPRSSMTAQEVLDFQADVDAMFALVDTRKADCIPMLLGYVNAGDPQVNDDSFFDSSLEVKPFNDEFFLPKLQADYQSTLNTDDYSLIDIYNFIRNNYAELLSSDGLHETAQGYIKYREFIVDRTANILQGNTIPVINPAPTLDSGNKVYVTLGTDETNSDGLNAFNREFIGGSASIKASLSDLNGDTAKPRLKPVTGWFTNLPNLGTRPGATDFDGTTLFANQVLDNCAFDGAVKTLTYTIDRLDPNTNYTFEFLAVRAFTSTEETIISSGAESVVITSSADPAEQPSGFSVQSDSNGEIVFTQTTNNGSNHYLNGFSLQKTA